MSSGLDRDPYQLDSWIGKVVSVFSVSGVRHLGRLIAVDPVSSSVVLLRQESQEISLLPWIDLDKLTVVSEDIDQESEKLRQNLLLSNTNTEVAGVSKKSVIDWLEKHQLRVSQEAEDVILVEGGLAKLRPPYRPSEIECSNVIILDRVTSILTGMSTGF